MGETKSRARPVKDMLGRSRSLVLHTKSKPRFFLIAIPGNPPRGDRNQRPKCLRRPGRSVGHVERSISGRSITQLDLPGRAQVGQSAMSNGRVQLNRSGRSNHSVRSCQSVRSIGPLRSVSHVSYIDQVGSVGQVSHIGQFPQVVGRSCRSDS